MSTSGFYKHMLMATQHSHKYVFIQVHRHALSVCSPALSWQTPISEKPIR